MQVYIDRNGQRFGPYSVEEINCYLAEGSLLPSDQAWYDGEMDWKPLTQVAGVIASSPTPLSEEWNTTEKPTEPLPPAIIHSTTEKPTIEAPEEGKTKESSSWKIIAKIAAILGFFLSIYAAYQELEEREERSRKQEQKKKELWDNFGKTPNR